MKRLAAALTGIVLIATAMSGCDSSTGPTTVTVHDTVTKIVYYNDPFAKSAALVHGQWQIVAGVDTATATLFQDTTKVSATVQWNNGSVWSLTSTKLTKDSLSLVDATGKLYMWAKLTDTTNHKVVGMTGTYFNLNNPSAGNPTWKGKRTF